MMKTKRIVNILLCLLMIASCTTSKTAIKTESRIDDSLHVAIKDTMHVTDTVFVTVTKKDSLHATLITTEDKNVTTWEKYTKTSVDERGNPVTETRESGSETKTIRNLEATLTRVTDSLAYYKRLYEATQKYDSIYFNKTQAEQKEELTKTKKASAFSIALNFLLLLIALVIIYVVYRIYKSKLLWL